MDQPAPKAPSGQTARIITGLALGLGALLVILFSPLWLLTLIVAVIAGLGMKEYLALVLPGPWRLEAFAGLAAAVLVPLACLAGPLAAAGALGLGPGLVGRGRLWGGRRTGGNAGAGSCACFSGSFTWAAFSRAFCWRPNCPRAAGCSSF